MRTSATTTKITDHQSELRESVPKALTVSKDSQRLGLHRCVGDVAVFGHAARLGNWCAERSMAGRSCTGRGLRLAASTSAASPAATRPATPAAKRAAPACSSVRTRSATASAVSPGSTGTAAWARMGPVHRLGHQVHGAAVQLDAGRQRTGVRVEPGKRRQQAGMDIQHPSLPGLHQQRRQQPHVARQRRERSRPLPAASAPSTAPHVPPGLRENCRCVNARCRHAPHPSRHASPAHRTSSRARAPISAPDSPGRAPRSARPSRSTHALIRIAVRARVPPSPRPAAGRSDAAAMQVLHDVTDPRNALTLIAAIPPPHRDRPPATALDPAVEVRSVCHRSRRRCAPASRTPRDRPVGLDGDGVVRRRPQQIAPAALRR